MSERAVVVATANRFVAFGYFRSMEGDTIKLRKARIANYWPAENRGFLGLATLGPVKGARISNAADLELRNVAAIAECSPDAVAAWEKAPWAKCN